MDDLDRYILVDIILIVIIIIIYEILFVTN